MKLFLSLVILLFSIPAQAEITLWTDPDYGIVLSYPDGWKTQVNDHSGQRLHIVAPGAQDMAQCKLTAEEDRRFEIFPSKFLQNIVPRELGDLFWYDYFANYQNTQINYLAEGGGLGAGYATFVDFSYTGNYNKIARPMRGLAYATIYHDMRVVLECSADARNYAGWYPIFSSIVKSVGFSPRFQGKLYGTYRNFFHDYPIYLPESGVGTGGY